MKTKITILFIICIQSFYVTSQELNKNFEIEIDPRIELLSIFLSYTDWPYFGKFEDSTYQYYQKVQAHFDKYKDHPNLAWFEKASENWNLDDLPTLILWVSNPPEMEQVHPYPLHPSCQLDTIEFQTLIMKLNEYAKDTKFIDFWNENQGFYSQCEKVIKEQLPYMMYVQLMMDFYGEHKGQFKFIPAPMFKWFSCGPQLITSEGRMPHFISTFSKYENGIPYFTDERLRELIFHEFGHSFVNPVCEKNRTEIFNHEDFYEYMKNDMSSIAYTYWFSAFHEHIVRTCEGMLLEKAGYTYEAEENYKENLRKGFYLLPFFKEKMEYYDQHREQFETFEEFFPELLKVFDEVEPVHSVRSVNPGIYLREHQKGLLVRRVADKSPLRNQIHKGDIIMTINEQVVNTNNDISMFFDLWYDSDDQKEINLKLYCNNKIIHQSLSVIKEECTTFKFKERNH